MTPTRLISIILTLSLLNMMVGCATVTNRSVSQFMIKPSEKIRRIHMPAVIHSVITPEGDTVLFEDGGGLYDLQSETISGATRSGDRISFGPGEITAVQIIDESSGQPLLRDMSFAAFKDNVKECPSAQVGNAVTPLCNTITFEPYGLLDENSGIVKGSTREGFLVEKRLEDIYSIGVTNKSGDAGIIVILCLAIVVVLITAQGGWIDLSGD